MHAAIRRQEEYGISVRIDGEDCLIYIKGNLKTKFEMIWDH